MDFNNPQQRAAFLDLHSNNPREGPGDKASTLRALAVVTAESAPRRILDVGCGPGLQTQHLLDELIGQVSDSTDKALELVAVDLHPPYIDLVNQWAGLYPAGTVTAYCANMKGLRMNEVFTQQPFDLIWCEGAAYFMGVSEALKHWRSLLGDPGYVAFSECVFLREDLPEAVRRHWAEYPAMTNVEGVANWVREAGFQLLEHFVLPPEAWWAYYDPLQARVNALRDKYRSDPDGAMVLVEGQNEIDVYREYSGYFGYAFFVAKKR